MMEEKTTTQPQSSEEMPNDSNTELESTETRTGTKVKKPAAKAKKSARPKKRKTKGKSNKTRVRRTTLFPASSFEEALTIPNAIQKHASRKKNPAIDTF